MPKWTSEAESICLSNKREIISQTPQIISDLIKRFERNTAEYRNLKYNETPIRVEFVNPFWKALGGAVDNEKGYAMSYRDVIHEWKIRKLRNKIAQMRSIIKFKKKDHK